MSTPNKADVYSPEETDARREAALKRMLATPHKPHEPLSKAGRAEARPSRSRAKDREK